MALQSFLNLTLISSLSSSDCDFASVKATLDVIQVFFIEQSIKFDIFIYAETSPRINCVIDGILKFSDEDFKLTVNHVKDYKNWHPQLNESAVIFSVNATNFQHLFDDSVLNVDHIKKFKFLFVYDKIAARGIVKKLEYWAKSPIIIFAYYLQLNEENFHLLMPNWFSQNNCNSLFHETLNIFNSSTMQWIKKLENFERFRNFHGCMLVSYVNAFDSYFHYQDERKEYHGFIADIFKALSKVGNFTNYFQRIETDYVRSRWIYLAEKQALYFFVKILDITFFPISLSDFHYTSVYDDAQYIFVITPGEPYNNYEKMILPFDTETWIYLISTFALTFFVIFIVNFMPHKIQRIIFGEDIWTPTLNVVYIFFGLGQMKLPAKWFPRFILLMFIIFCLIFRTAYQSLLFEFMTSDMRKSSPKTIEDLKERNYTLAMAKSDDLIGVFNDTIRGKPFQPRYEIYPFHQYSNYSQQLSNHSAKLAVMTVTETLHYFADDHEHLDEKLMTTFRALGMSKNSFLFPLLYDVTERLIPAGIIMQLKKLHTWINYRKRIYVEKSSGPSILTMDDLMFGFVIWLGACGISSIFFILEFLVWPRENKKRRKNEIKRAKCAKIHPIICKTPASDILSQNYEEIYKVFRVKRKIREETYE